MIPLLCPGISGCSHLISLLAGLHFPLHGYFSTLPSRKHRACLSAAQMSNCPSPRNRNEHHNVLLHAEFRRPRIEVPNIVLQLDTEEVLSGDNVLRLVDKAVSRWVGILVLTGGEGSGGRLYQSACLLKSAIGDRAHLMISERADIAAAVEASGVVLSDQGLPTLVARNSLMRLIPDSLELPLIGRHVSTQNDAVHASSIEGADFLIHFIGQYELEELLANSVFKNVNIPIFIPASRLLDRIPNGRASCLLNLGASGLVVSLEELRALCDNELGRMFYGISERSKRKCHGPSTFHMSEGLDADNGYNNEVRVENFETMEDKERHLIGVERLVLLQAVNIIHEAAPLMEEVSLVMDAASQLGKPFLLAVVGEFNSGKSTVINALLGRRYLKDGVVPTTNEVTFLQYNEFGSNWEQHCERHPDGRLMCYLPVPMLKEMNIVDTPGTNVILQRQQYLTEEFVPRADLLLFVMSADRPFTESEVTFLRYTQKWKKKIVFVLNKSDTYQNLSELRQGISFIKMNAQKILNTEDITLFPVSARYALEAKLLALSHGGKVLGKASSFYSRWKNSGFEELENFLFSFLDLSTRSGLERMKLKLETPIRIADRLLSACEAILIRESQNANEDLNSADEIINFSKVFAAKIQSEGNSWKTQTLWLIDSTKVHVIKIVESILRLSNFELLASCIIGKDQFIKAQSVLCVEKDILTPTYSSTHKLLEEYAFWLASVNSHQKSMFKEAFEKRWPSFVDPLNQAPQELQGVRKAKHCIEVIGDFGVSAIARLFEQEIREMFLQTFGGLGMAGLSALLLTSVLQTTLEDLLALGLCSAGGLLAIASFPIRRQKIVNKVNKTADRLAKQLQEAMDMDRIECVEDMEKFLKNLVMPCQDAAQHRLHKSSTLQCRLSDVAQKLVSLKIEIQNLHLL